MTVVLLLLLAVLLTEVFAAAAPAPALVTADGRSTSLSTRQLDQQKLTTAQRPVTMVTSGVRLGSDQETYLLQSITFTLLFFRNATLVLEVCIGSLSCWKSARQPWARSEGSILSMFHSVTTSKGATTVKEQQKLTTVQRPVDHAVSAFTPKGSTTVKEQQVLSPVQPPVPGVVPAQRNMRAVLGQTITLPCRAPANVSIAAVKWSRPDLLPKYVLLFQNGQQVLGNQHLLFKNRVELKDKQMKKDDATEDSTRHHSIMAITLSVIGLIAIFAIVTAVVVAIVRKCTRCCHRD
ncbi:uncharacterized protein [Channa argus]|uniref:uncharacterized protein isoform X2 n=1 Tax=Channa argus TaxID=215402 RepID=UPI003521BD7D